MKKLFLLGVILFFSLSCKKEDSPTLSGSWNMKYSYSSSTAIHKGVLVLTQHSNNTLSGTFQYDYSSDYEQILSTSLIIDNTVTIERMMLNYKLSFQGTVNSTYTSISGLFYTNGTSMGTWSAEKFN